MEPLLTVTTSSSLVSSKVSRPCSSNPSSPAAVTEAVLRACILVLFAEGIETAVAGTVVSEGHSPLTTSVTSSLSEQRGGSEGDNVDVEAGIDDEAKAPGVQPAVSRAGCAFRIALLLLPPSPNSFLDAARSFLTLRFALLSTRSVANGVRLHRVRANDKEYTVSTGTGERTEEEGEGCGPKEGMRP